jgi:hypothetical protein
VHTHRQSRLTDRIRGIPPQVGARACGMRVPGIEQRFVDAETGGFQLRTAPREEYICADQAP